MKKETLKISIIFISLVTMLTSCNNDPNSPGYEFMPNMYRSGSYETYSENPIFSNGITSQHPVEGTISRGFIPFDYDKSLEDYLRAGRDLKNPLVFDGLPNGASCPKSRFL